MSKIFAALSVAFSLLGTGGVLAQGAASTAIGPTRVPGPALSSAPSPMPQDIASEVRAQIEPLPASAPAEQVQTALLNRFGGLGFAAMRNFQRVGNHYTAEVRTVEGVWISIEADPATGMVSSVP